MIFYLPIEPYEERYTLQLKNWTESRFLEHGISFVTVEGERLSNDNHISTGVVLDAYGRSYWGLTQTARLVYTLKTVKLSENDVIYIQDMFHPGYECLPYIFSQLPVRPKIFVRNWAQSTDRNDFTFKMRQWMRHYELMVNKTVDGIFVASTCMKDAMQTAMFDAPIYVVGLPFDKNEVKSKLKNPVEKNRRVLFSSRWDEEKQPNFYMDLIEKVKAYDEFFGDDEFAVCTSAEKLRSNNSKLLSKAYDLEKRGLLTIYENLSKEEYYRLLQSSSLHFNCALQDFISFTLCEASTFNVPSLMPAYLSFPEALNNDDRFMYIPWSIDSAIDKMKELLLSGIHSSYPAEYNHLTLDREIEIMLQ
jgi:hypothetical protein